MPVHKRWQASTRSRQGRSHGSGQKIARLDRPHGLGQKSGQKLENLGQKLKNQGRSQKLVAAHPGPAGAVHTNLEQQRIPNHFSHKTKAKKKIIKATKNDVGRDERNDVKIEKHDEIDKNDVKNQLKKVTSKVTKNKYYHK